MSTSVRPKYPDGRSTRLVETLYDEVTEFDLDDQDLGDMADPMHLMQPVQLAAGSRIVCIVDRYGRRAVVGKRSRREHVRRASGRAGTYWTSEGTHSIYRSSNGLLLSRFSKLGRVSSGRIFAADEHSAPTAVTEALGDTEKWECTPQKLGAIRRGALRFLGPAPVLADRFPLLASPDGAGFATTLEAIARASAREQNPWLDSYDAAAVARKLFGGNNYRKPFAREVIRHRPEILSSYALFRGLVPPEWIIDALRAIEGDSRILPWGGFFDHQYRSARSLLTRTPQPVLRRMLRQPATPMLIALRDTADMISHGGGAVRDIDAVAGAITLTGQRNIRSATDLHNLVGNVPPTVRDRFRSTRSLAGTATADAERALALDFPIVNDRRRVEGLTEFQWDEWLAMPAEARAEIVDACHEAYLEREHRADEARRQAYEAHRAARMAADAESVPWAADLTARLNASPQLGGLDVVVADSREQLLEWGAKMRNCIASYDDRRGIDLLLGLFRADELVANVQITREGGVVQLLGRYNRSFTDIEQLGADVGRAVLADLEALGVRVNPAGWGVSDLVA